MDSNTDSIDRWCTTCKHVGTNPSRDSSSYRCFAPQNPYVINLVDGTRAYAIVFCGTHRSAPCTEHKNVCGSEGTWWEQAPPRPSASYDTPIPSKEPTSRTSVKVNLSKADLNSLLGM